MKKCSKCGAKMIADRSRVFTSYPPQYLFKCPSCGNTEYGLCSENDTDEEWDSLTNIPGEIINENKETIDDNCTNWNSIRNWAAMFAMNGLITSDTEMTFNEKQIASMAVAQADELIKQLKKQ